MKKIKEKKPRSPVEKALFKTILFTVYPGFVLHSLVVAPLYTICESNVGVPAAITVALYFLFVLIDILAFFIAFSVIIYGMCEMSLRDMKRVLILIAISPFFKYLLKLIISPFVDGFISIDDLTIDIFSYVVSGSMEVLQFVIVTLLSMSSAKKYRQAQLLYGESNFNEETKNIHKHNKYSKKDARKKSSVAIKQIQFTPMIPFEKIFSLRNPLQIGAIISALVIIIGRVGSLIISDLNSNWKIVGVNQYLSFFAPYILEIAVGAIGYFLMLYIFIQIHSKISKK